MKTEKQPLVSVVTTTYNKFQYLFETLDSVFMQEYSNIELIIGDDGSVNFPRGEIERFIEEHKRENIVNTIILHEEQNHGTVWNCDNCRRHANGTYIMGIASDDRFYDEKVISDVVSFFQDTGAEIITCKREYVDSETEAPLIVMPDEEYSKWLKTLPVSKLYEKMGSIGFISGSNTYYTRAFYEKMGGYDKNYKYIEDYPFIMRTLRCNNKIYFFDRITIKYRFGAGISTASHKNNSFRTAMYEDRKRYMNQEIIPYMDRWPWWRKAQMRTRLARFIIEENTRDNSNLRVYSKLFLKSPVGTIAQIIYMGRYKLKIKRGSRGK